MTDVQMPSSPVISPRSIDTPPAPLDGDYDEEVHANVTPPPPPPPPSANDNNDGPSEIPTEKQEQLSREPLEPLSPDGELQNYSFSHDTPKEQSGCDPNVQLSPKTTSQIPTKPITNKPPIGNRPPKPQSSGSSTKEEYGTGIDAMLENIEKEFMMIRTQGSFQFHQKSSATKPNGSLREVISARTTRIMATAARINLQTVERKRHLWKTQTLEAYCRKPCTIFRPQWNPSSRPSSKQELERTHSL